MPDFIVWSLKVTVNQQAINQAYPLKKTHDSGIRGMQCFWMVLGVLCNVIGAPGIK